MKSRDSVTLAGLALTFAVGGCANVAEYRIVSKERLKNDRGHVVGHREVLRFDGSHETTVRDIRYTPYFDAQGRLIGYEEPIGGGSADIRDLNGRRIGIRHVDWRSLATNPNPAGFTIVVRPRDAERVSLVARPVPGE